MKKTCTLIALTLFCLSTFAQNTWEQITPIGDLPSARHGHSMVTIDSLVYLFGGTDDSKNLTSNLKDILL
ncbi:MAG TPA: kelch repeat-containing protein [Bacteroidales bacterium]|nr:kelch repeat-containing protein [Bacteroidales bacterium]